MHMQPLGISTYQMLEAKFYSLSVCLEVAIANRVRSFSAEKVLASRFSLLASQRGKKEILGYTALQKTSCICSHPPFYVAINFIEHLQLV